MAAFRTKRSEDGRVMIPAAYRKQLKFMPGEALMGDIRNKVLPLFSTDTLLEKAQTLVTKYAKAQSLTERLRQMREEDKVLEQRD